MNKCAQQHKFTCIQRLNKLILRKIVPNDKIYVK